MLPRDLLAHQAGVVNRRQLLEAGVQDHDIRRLERRRELARVHRGVWVGHTGTLAWEQAAWAAVLATEPSALAGRSALRAVEGPGHGLSESPLHVAVPGDRHPVVPGLLVARRRDLDRLVQPGSPPRLRLEEAVIDLAEAAPTDVAAVHELARAVQRRLTTADRLLAAARARPRLARRRWLESVLDDVATGAASVLEHGYLTRVERPHGLPRARRQVRDVLRRGVVYRDVELCGLVLELDGRLGHETGRGREFDFDRDLETAAAGRRTVRLSFGQVFDRACWTAHQIGLLATAHGWTGTLDRCPVC